MKLKFLISNDQCSYTDAVAATIARGGIFNEGTCTDNTKTLFSYVDLNMPLASVFEQTLKSHIYRKAPKRPFNF